MKYTIHGFQQEKLIKLGLDNDDALILSVLRDMYARKSMDFKIINSERFVWVNQKYLLEQIPIIGSESKLRKKIRKFDEINLIERKVFYEKNGIRGTYSYINITLLFDELTEYDTVCKNDIQGACKNNIGGMSKKHSKDSSIKDSINIIYSLVIEYLNSKTGKSYKSTTRKTQSLIKARIDEGFKEEEFFKVIDNKVAEWKGTEYEKYLRPETLFGNKFEGYLNQDFGSGTKEISKGNLNIKKGNFDY